MKKTYVLAITGASGSIFGLRVLQELARVSRLFVCVSSSAIPIVRAETALDLSVPDSQRALREYASSDEVHLYRE
ncbi:MAG: flavoprotein [Thermodesulfovibrionales bacterium]